MALIKIKDKIDKSLVHASKSTIKCAHNKFLVDGVHLPNVNFGLCDLCVKENLSTVPFKSSPTEINSLV